MSVQNRLSLSQPISSRAYTIWAILLFLIKYPIDHYIATTLFNKPWDLLVYFSFLRNPLFSAEQANTNFWAAMLAAAMPFLVVGLFLTLRRLKTVGLAAWWVILIFVPFLNILFFIVLALPVFGPSDPIYQYKKIAGAKWVSKDKKKAIGIGGLTSGGLLFGGIVTIVKVAGFYGITLFAGLPFVASFLLVALVSTEHPLTLKQSIVYGSIPALLGTGLCLVTLFEGGICVLMALPFLLALSWLGALAAYYVSPKSTPVGKSLKSLLLIPALLFIDFGVTSPEDRPVVSTIVVKALPEVIWENVIRFPAIDTGGNENKASYVPRLLRAELLEERVGGVRRCIFDQGTFHEPIQVWDPPHNLTFGVDSQIARLEKYVNVVRGQFLLVPQSDGATKIIGTTWYRSRVFPLFYWNLWADYFIHRIHMRALNHIKNISET